MNSSINSFKIEGRMKSPLYVGFVTNLYRRLIDGENVDLKLETDKLMTIFNREFSCGRLFLENGLDLMNTNSPNHIGLRIGKVSLKGDKIKIELDDGYKLNQFDAIRFLNSNLGMIVNYLYDEKLKLVNSATKICYIDNKIGLKSNDIVCKTQDYLLEMEFKNKKPIRRIKINYEFIAHKGEALFASVSDGVNYVSTYGPIVENAMNAPIDIKSIKKHLSKLGDTPYVSDIINVEIDDNVFIQIKTINDIRRELIERLNFKRMESKVEYIEKDVSFNKFIDNNNKGNNIVESSEHKITLCASIFNEEQLKACLDEGIDRVYVNSKQLFDKYKELENVYYIVPRCRFDLTDLLDDNILISDYFDFSKVNSAYGNYPLNVFNSYTAYYLKENGLCNIPVSVELSANEIDYLIKTFTAKFGYADFEVLSYGRVENMVIKGNILGILDNKYSYCLEDEKNRRFPLYYDGVNTHIYNYDLKMDYHDGVSIKMDFYDEDYLKVRNIVNKYQNYKMIYKNN